MYINLDHSPSVEAAKAGIDAGFEFIHIDYSQANRDATDDEIIAATSEVVEYAKQTTGALVESEPHYFGGSSNVHPEAIDYEEIRKTFSTPEGAAAFVAKTGIDTFAAAIGNLHGRYPVPKQLDLDLLQRIRDAIDCNISLHGGSGTPGHYFNDAARIGVSKINVNSDLRYAYRTTLEAQLRATRTSTPSSRSWDRSSTPCRRSSRTGSRPSARSATRSPELRGPHLVCSVALPVDGEDPRRPTG